MHANNRKCRKGIATAIAAALSMSMGICALVPSAALAADSLPKASGQEQYEQRVVAKATSLDDTQGGKVIAHEGDLWLLGYDTKEAAESAAKELDNADGVAASVDSAFGVAEGATIDPDTTTTASADDNPISNKKEQKSWKGAIALVDTGASGANVIDKVTVLSGTADDDMGHGTRMAQFMAQVSPTAKVVSVKALDSTGTGTISSVVAAMDLAIKNHAKVINLSISAKATEENSVLKEEIQKAWDNGIMVVGAAGNDGQDASGFVPGGIDSAFIVGACDANGTKIGSSNYGKTVDLNVLASSTSEAAAKASAWLAANASDVADVNSAVGRGLFFPTDPANNVPVSGNAGSGNDGLFHTQDYVTGWRVDDVSTNHFVLFMSISDVQDMKALCTGYAQNTNSAVVTATELRGSWTKNGTTYTSAFIFDGIDVNSDVWLRVEQPAANWIMLVRFDGSGDLGSGRTGAAINIYTPGSHPHSPSTVTFNANGGTVGTKTMNVETGNTVGSNSSPGTLPGTNSPWDITNNIPVKDGFRFDGWYTAADGGTQVTTGSQWGYAAGVTDKQSDFSGIHKGYFWHVLNDGSGWEDLSWVYPWDITLYAHWTDIRYYIAYDGNGADTGAMTDSTATRDSAFTLPASAFSKVGYEFAGWNTKADGSGINYNDKASVTNLTEATKKITLYAQWHATSYTVNFDKNAVDASGTMASQTMPSANPKNLNTHTYTRFGYEFTGWNTKADGTGTKIADGAAVKDLAPAGKTATLYAQWKPIDTSVAMSSGTFYVRIHAGETAHINGLPAGTTYTVEEQPAAGWTLIDSSGTVGQIASRRTSQAWFKNKPDQNPSKLECSIKLYAYKTVDGTQPADGTSYKFQLRDSSGKVLQTKQSSTGGIVEFDSLRYYKDETRDDTGNHAYSIVEVKGDDTTLTYDTHTENVTVNVAEQSSTDGKKKLVATAKTDSDGVIFDNTHRPGTLVLKKAVQGTSGASAAFTFEARLVDAEGKPVTSISAAVLDASGKGTPATRSASDGVYTFQITAAQSVRIDGLPRGTVYTVSEKALPAGYAYVSSDGTEGTIESNATKTATVTNSYHAEGDVTFAATKQVTGLEASGWSFELLDSSGKVVSTAVSGSDGKVSFSPISYRKDSTADDTGTHVYTIREVKGTRTDVKYDAHVLTEKVKVTDDGAGHLVCTVTSSGSSTFVNTPLAVMPQTGSAGMLRAAAVGLAVAAASVAGYLAMKFRKR